MINKKEAHADGTVVTGTLFVNSKPFYVLFDSGAIHSFISVQATSQSCLDSHKLIVKYQINLPNWQIVERSTIYKDIPITLSRESFRRDLIRLNQPEFDLILGMNWFMTYVAVINCKLKRFVIRS